MKEQKQRQKSFASAAGQKQETSFDVSCRNGGLRLKRPMVAEQTECHISFGIGGIYLPREQKDLKRSLLPEANSI